MGSWCLRFPRCLGGVSTATALMAMWRHGVCSGCVGLATADGDASSTTRSPSAQRGGQGGVQVLDLGHSERYQLLTGVAALLLPRMPSGQLRWRVYVR